MKKRILSMILALVMLFSLLPAQAFAADSEPDLIEAAEEPAETPEIASEPENLTPSSPTLSVLASGDFWTLYDDGKLVIFGEMGDYNDEDTAPWYENRSSIKTVEIKSGVTKIGNNAFCDCRSLTSITIGSGVTSIGDYAFYCCDSLTSITIPDGVTSIGDWAFSSCHSLTSITIPNCVTSIGSGVFYWCDSLTSITIPDGVTSIGDGAFCYCYSLTSITIPDGVTSIGDDAFSDCYSLTSITIPNSVTSIGDYAFFLCDSLLSITIGSGVTSIGDGAFEYCDSLADVYYTGTKAQWNAVSIGIDNDCLTDATIHYNSTPEEPVLASGDFWTLYDDGRLVIFGEMGDYDCGEAPWYEKISSIKSVEIGSGVTSIGNYAFYDCYNLTSITIPDSVTSIGDSAFEDCYSLTSITIPDSVTSIGEGTFSSCESLTSITIGSGVTSIGIYAFYNCYSLTSITIPDSVTSIGDYAFYSCYSLTSITIPNSVTSIGDGAFYNCYSLTSITIPDGVTSIGEGTFSSCESLTSITIGSGVTSIGMGAFGECSSLTSITIPDSVTSIGDGAFYECRSLKDVYYSGTEAQWAAITIGDYNDCLTSATIHYNSAPGQMPIVIKFPIPNADANIETEYTQKWIDKVEELSEGRIKFNFTSGGALGNYDELLWDTISGVYDMTMCEPANLVSCVPESVILNYPMLLSDYAHCDAVFDGEVGDWWKGLVEENVGLVPMNTFYCGFRYTMSQGEIKTLDDIPGMIIRVPGAQTYIDTFNMLGFDCVTMAFSEAYSAMECGVINAVEIPLQILWTSGYYNLCNYLLGSRHIFSENCIFANKEFLDSLPEEYLDILTSALEEVTAEERRECERREAQLIGDFAAKGIKYNEFGAEDQAKIVEIFTPYWQKDAPALCDEAMPMLQKIIGLRGAGTLDCSCVFNANGGAGAPDTLSFLPGEAVTLSNTVPVREGYRFLGWASAADAVLPAYMPGGTYSFNKDVTLFAVWELIPVGGVVLSMDDTLAYSGRQLRVPINISGNTGVALLNFKIEYDHSVLKLVGFEDGLMTDWTVGIGEGEKAVWVETANFRENGTVLTLIFEAADGVTSGSTFIRLTGLTGYDSAEHLLELSSVSAFVQLSERLPGDVTGDGQVNALDLLRLKKYLAHLPVEIAETNADVTGDGSVGATDLLRLKKYLAGISVTLE